MFKKYSFPFLLFLLLIVKINSSSLYTTGSNLRGQLGNFNNLQANLVSVEGKKIKLICSGQEHVAVVTTNNEVYTWGDNRRISVGFNSVNDLFYTPQLIFSSPNPISDLQCGEAHTLVVINSTLIFGFGEGTNAALGTGNNQPLRTISQITALSTHAFTKFIAFGTNSFGFEANTQRLFGWGQNQDFQLGIPNTGNVVRFSPVLVFNSTTKMVTGDTSYTIILDNSGRIYACGNNIGGRLGLNNNTITNQPTLVLVQPLSQTGKTFTYIASGGSSSFALASDGTLYAWGANSNGQLGLPAQTTVLNPTVVPYGEITGTIVFISVSNGHTMVLNNAGKLFTSGSNDQGQLGINSFTTQVVGFRAVASNLVFLSVQTSLSNTYALTTDGNFYVWGGITRFGIPVERSTLGKITFDTSLKVKKLISGFKVSVLLDGQNQLWGWGSNNPRLNTAGDFIDRFYPDKFNGTGGIIFQDLSINGGSAVNLGHILASVSATSTVTPTTPLVPYAWGKNSRGQLGNQEVSDRINPVQSIVSNTLIIKKISAGAEHSVMIAKPNGGNFFQYYVWGDNRLNQIGLSVLQTSFVRLVNDGSDIIDGDTGDYHSIMLLREGSLSLLGTGDNTYGQLCIGNQEKSDIFTPSQAFKNTLANTTIKSIICGTSTTWIVTQNDGVWVCGDDNVGTLGLGQQKNYTVPTKHTHPLFSNTTQIHKIIPAKSTGRHTIVITTTGDVYVMGLNNNGQLGLSHTNNVLTPTKLTSPSTGDVGLDASSGADHSVFLFGRVDCPQNCYANVSRGVCNPFDGICSCNSTYYGSDCGLSRCLPDETCSNGNGTCNTSTGKCQCKTGYQGTTCNEKLCLNNCSGKGTCLFNLGVCRCNPGFVGDDCSKVSSAGKYSISLSLLFFILVFIV